MSIWWEKTVEYKFILSLGQAGKLFLAPLDGNHEGAGDAMISAGTKWLLIEFKRDVNEIETEISKFQNFKTAKKSLSSDDGHHFLVFGMLSKNSRMVLGARTYFSDKRPKTFLDLLAWGTSLAKFSAYLNAFINFKRSGKGGSGSGLQFADFALVAGVTEEGMMVSCMSLDEFLRQQELDVDIHSESKREMDAPSA